MIGNQVKLSITTGDKVHVRELLALIEKNEWGKELVRNGHIKDPVMLVIDGKMIQNSNLPHLDVTERSKIDFYVMFAGGL